MKKEPPPPKIGRPKSDNPASSVIVLRVTPETKSAYVSEAQKSPERTLSAWMLARCDEALPGKKRNP